MIHMQIPKFLPWAARQAGISEAEAAALWRQATAEAEHFTGEREGSEFSALAVECFLELLDGKPGYVAPTDAGCATEAAWMTRHQTRMAEHFLNSSASVFLSWLAPWQNLGGRKEAAF
jgi:hypothetical protein